MTTPELLKYCKLPCLDMSFTFGKTFAMPARNKVLLNATGLLGPEFLTFSLKAEGPHEIVLSGESCGEDYCGGLLVDLNGGRDWRVCWFILRSGSCRLYLHDGCSLAKDGTTAEEMGLEERNKNLTRSHNWLQIF